MTFTFSKMHGLGNDYVYINCLNQTIEDPGAVSEFVSNRHFGIGSDGLVLIQSSKQADFYMRMFNADGSEGKMCGNAIRCVGKYVYDNGLTDKTKISIETLSGIKHLDLFVKDGKVESASVDMGKAILEPSKIPVLSDEKRFINKPIEVLDKTYNVTCVSMGNPHAVTFCKNVMGLDLEKTGPHFENHKLFPDRINTEFVEVIDEKTIKMRVWERGSGETFACGTGACASVVASVLNGHCRADTEVCVILLGGKLYITYKSDGTVIMRGSATHVFDGTITI